MGFGPIMAHKKGSDQWEERNCTYTLKNKGSSITKFSLFSKLIIRYITQEQSSDWLSEIEKMGNINKL